MMTHQMYDDRTVNGIRSIMIVELTVSDVNRIVGRYMLFNYNVIMIFYVLKQMISYNNIIDIPTKYICF